MILNRNIKSCSPFLIITVLLVLLLNSCSKKTVKENLTALIVSKAYDDTSYECWVHNIGEEDINKSSKSRKDMIDILENYIYE